MISNLCQLKSSVPLKEKEKLCNHKLEKSIEYK